MIFSKKQKYLCAVCDGVSVPITEIPDEAFSQGMLGLGFGQEPQGEQFYSPVKGKIVGISDTRHAYSIQTEDGLDILIHIGVDTVELAGSGFEPCVKEGDEVNIGDPIARASITLIRERGYNPITAVLVTNSEKIKNIAYKFGEKKGGNDPVMYFDIK